MVTDQTPTKSTSQSLGETAFIAPFVLLMIAPVVVSWLLAQPKSEADSSTNSPDWVPVISAAAQVVLCGGLIWNFRSTYFQAFPFRVSWTGVITGLIGVVLWVLLCLPRWELAVAEAIGLGAMLPSRPGVNPFETYHGMALVAFLALRFVVLAAIVPVVEELFVRGWLLRWVAAAENWDTQELRTVGWKPMLVVLVYAVATHPGEAIAAIVWFSLINWLMKRTGNFWDCVAAHAVTNLALGIWILCSGDWRLW